MKLSKFWIFGQSSISIPNFTLQISSKRIFSCQYLVCLWLSQISACKYQSEKTITVFMPCTRAQGLKVRALSENSKNSLSRRELKKAEPEKADPRSGCSPERGAKGWGLRSLQVFAPLTLPLLQAPLYVPLLGARHRRALQHSLHVPYLRRKRG